ncbi:MmcQ/YjbR family DNA-binding protein [Streptomyces armeniacus]|uniref:MmcQ/YjbR family DNA-binding protein n=1 Tax=Streptomyces armeniacus TaxID=83291 RepID=A0A345XZD2_9ACTN|nr:MmcQ/YjbR family DNA-binding protein [Streptomyces armeniacus]AXK36998.1 MmcQ/YjbR family DNA-binding protein [Streptomyces armeniacus]
MVDRDVPLDILDRLRSVCLRLPEAYEEEAWAGTRWRVRLRTFAHVLRIESGWPPAFARAVGSDGPVTVVTFRAGGAELDALRLLGPPYFYGGWGRDAVGMVLDGPEGRQGADTGWDELTELLIESYRLLAPKKLAAQIAHPPE